MMMIILVITINAATVLHNGGRDHDRSSTMVAVTTTTGGGELDILLMMIRLVLSQSIKNTFSFSLFFRKYGFSWVCCCLWVLICVVATGMIEIFGVVERKMERIGERFVLEHCC